MEEGDIIKFGYINDRDWHIGTGDTIRINIGEYIQFYAMHFFLKSMGIKEENIIGATFEDWLKNQDSDIILVVTNIKYEEYIKLCRVHHVVCLGMENFGNAISQKGNIDIISNEMIGCRDEYMFSQLYAIGLTNIYINGCISIILPRKKNALGDEVFIVDAPIELLEYIPQNIRKKAIVRTHEYYFDNPKDRRELYSIARKQYVEYYENAKLVITSRLHLAAPCIAWGIPVILVRKNPYITFSWIDRYLPIYTPDLYNTIDWNPKQIDIEDEKRILFRDMSYLVTKKYYSLQDRMDVDSIYRIREYKPYGGYYNTLIDGLKRIMEKDYDSDESFEYIIWGITFNAEYLYEYISDNYKNATMVYAIDRYKRISFHGLNTVIPKDVGSGFANRVVFVIPTGAVQEAKRELIGMQCKSIYFVAEAFIEETDL